MKRYHNLFRRMRMILASLSILALGFPGGEATATQVTLRDANSVVTFNTQSTDPGPPGQYQWTVDGVDHIAEQWFWYREGSAGGEISLDQLQQTGLTILDVNNDTHDDFMLVTYQDANNRLEFQLRYLLTGGTIGSNDSALMEIIRIRNLTADQPIDLHFFQYVDFDLRDSAGDDTVRITGTPPNTAYQFDPFFQVGETVVSPPPSHYEARVFSATRDSLTDASPTTLADLAGPLGPADVTWAFQWDKVLVPGDVLLITKDKNLQGVIPEPSTWALAAWLGGGLLLRKARGRSAELPG